MKIQTISKLFFSIFILAFTANTYAFCGFYAARAGSSLYNQSSKVVIAQDGQYQAITMASDFEGDAKDFAMVVPVPSILKRDQIHTVDNNVITHLDQYTAPRLVEYFDRSPCEPQILYRSSAVPVASPASIQKKLKAGEDSLGVTIEAKYAVGVYDILLLSAQQSNGLVSWLKQNQYQLPKGAEPIINSYLAMGMKFFVAKVNIQRHSKMAYAFLKPIRIHYRSSNYMLPIRLGMLNAKGPQELFVYHLNRKGRVITTNYPNVKLATNKEIPVFNKNDFDAFYKAMFDKQVQQNNRRGVFLEYAWDMNWCDPCAADPLSDSELQQLGVFWLDQPQNNDKSSNKIRSTTPPRLIRQISKRKNVFVTRMHITYDKAHFPKDLAFKVTDNRQNFQGRFVIRHAWKGDENECKAAKMYVNKTLPKRHEREAQTMANLTGWDINSIRKRMKSENPKLNKTSLGSQSSGANQVE